MCERGLVSGGEGGSSVTARLWRRCELRVGVANIRWWWTMEPDNSGRSGRRRWRRWMVVIDADPGGWRRKFSRRGAVGSRS